MLKSSTKKSAGIVRLAALMAASLMVSGCSYMASDSCADQANLPKPERGLRGCEGGFFSARKQRETVYQGDDSPRLWSGAELRRAPNVDPAAVNQAPAARTAIAAWSGALRVDLAPDEGAIAKDVADIKSAGISKFDPDEKVTVKFEKATLDFFLKQMLGGALGVSYVGPDDLSGSVTFRTEQPISKSQVLQVVRDVLGRNGLEMRYMNGVYQIAAPEQMASLQQTTVAGRASDQETRVLRLHKGKAAEVIRFVKQLVPDEITLMASSGGDSIIVKAPATELNRVAELVSLSDGSLADDRVAIIPLMQSSPDKIAQQLGEFYRAQAEAATIVPLDNQQALLVGTKDRRTLQGIKELVRRLDRDTGGDSTMRIIPLIHLAADEIVQQLTAVYATSGVAGAAYAPAAVAVQNGGNPDAAPQATRAPSLAPPVQVPRAVTSDEGGFSSPGFALNGGSGAGLSNGGSNGAGGNYGAGGSNTAAAIAATTGGAPVAVGPTVKFVADTRNNTVMIYSSYSLYKMVRDRLRVLDVPQAQVVIEATVAEVTLNDDLTRGVEAFLTSKGLNMGSSASGVVTQNIQGGGFLHAQFGIGGVTADIIIQALQSVTNVKVISTPYLTVVDGKTARLVIGDQVPFSTTTQSTQLTGTTTVTQQITVKDTGIQLEVTPKIRADNSTALNINQSVSAVKDTNTANTLTPTISTRSVKSDVIVQSGSTIMLAGLVQEGSNKTETGVPVARNIPVVGELFKQSKDTVTREELIVLITPRVIRNSSQLENITRQMRGVMNIRG